MGVETLLIPCLIGCPDLHSTIPPSLSVLRVMVYFCTELLACREQVPCQLGVVRREILLGLSLSLSMKRSNPRLSGEKGFIRVAKDVEHAS